VRRPRLRARVLLLTCAFGLALFAITFGLSWQAELAQERWTRLLAVETAAIERLEEVIRAQNAFRAAQGGQAGRLSYTIVAQLLNDPVFDSIDVARLRARIRAFASLLHDPETRAEDLDAASFAVTNEAQRIIEQHRHAVSQQIPELQRDTRAMMQSGLAVAWIVVLVSFAVVQATLRKVVRPVEELAASADRIAAGDLTARAPVAGDAEIARLGIAFNRMADELKARARTDDLTALPNFRAFRERIDAEIDRAARYELRFAVLLLDLDRFKRYNDTFGHLAGNDALQRVARTLRESVRSVDFAARYGGEELVVILPEIDAASTAVIAERVRSAIEALPAPEGGANVTVSIGAAIYPDDGMTPEALFKTADERLYEAKERGRNCVVAPTPAAPRSAGRQSA
jgi:diguanylate cyclase (GGDEF)-like protein